jgi:hypothetical protein
MRDIDNPNGIAFYREIQHLASDVNAIMSRENIAERLAMFRTVYDLIELLGDLRESYGILALELTQ